MKISNLFARDLGFCGACAAVLALSAALSPRARAFGGLWSSQGPGVKQSAERIVFVDNPDATLTAIIEIEYAGPAQRFAWVIPVPGKPAVGVSSRTVFDRLDAATSPQYWVASAVEGMCMQSDDAGASVDASDGMAGAQSADDPSQGPGPVVVVDRGSVGPYDYVTIMLDPTLSDASQVATDWLTSNGYDLTGLDGAVLGPYLSDGLNLLAFKLQPDADASAIRPVLLTYERELPMIPIRPTAVAAQDDMAIEVWVIGPSQAVPDNYASLVLNDARIDWLSGQRYVAGTLPAGGVGPAGPSLKKPGNYDAVVTAAADEAGGQGFVTELGAPASQFREQVWSALDAQIFATLSSHSYTDGLDAILEANGHYGGWDGWKDALASATKLPAGVTIEQFGADPEHYRGAVKVDAAVFLQLLHDEVVGPVADAASLLYRAPYITRLFSTMSASEMTLDPIFNYNSELALVSNVHVAQQVTRCDSSLNASDAPWRIQLPQGGAVVGQGDQGWPVVQESMPANLKIVRLSTRGSGEVVKDNSDDIARTLWEAAGASGTDAPPLPPPQNGLMIGGTQSLMARGQVPDTKAPSDSMPAHHAAGDGCSALHVGTGPRASSGLALLFVGLLLARLRWFLQTKAR